MKPGMPLAMAAPAAPTSMVTLRDCGEDRLVAELVRVLRGRGRGAASAAQKARSHLRSRSRDEVLVGAGEDDCAVIGRGGDRVWQLLKTDCVVEGVHFLPDTEPRRVGWKAMARVLSDIAAMGGLPRHALVTIAVSPDAEVRRLRAIYTGIRSAAERFGVRVVGGETSRSPGPAGPLVLSVALTGSVEKARCALRSGGRVGDDLFVTGRLGGSIRGRHLDFLPRVEEARWLTGAFSIHAMMDLSDGLAADLPRLARASGTGFHISTETLPLARGCTPEAALSDGEDYELLFAVSPRDSARLMRAWARKFPKLPLTHIGRLERPAAAAAQRQLSPPTARGFDHFA